MTVAEYVIDFIAKQEIKDVFTVSGGGSMFLLEALGNHPKLKYWCNHHEQASAMAAEAYARLQGNFGVCLVSTAPAGTNAITGVACAWNDSIPVMFISGQANSKNLIGNTGLRQRGVHEVDIVSLVKPITKYAHIVLDPNEIKTVMVDALWEMRMGRPGPVWIDIPVNIQGAEITIDPPVRYDPPYQMAMSDAEAPFRDLYEKAERPVLLLGGGATRNIKAYLEWATSRNIPIVCTKNAYGYIPYDTPNYMRMIGINGNREANATVQGADLIIAMGSRLTFPAIGYNTKAFAPNAKKIIVDIDKNQTDHSLIEADLIINEDAITCLYDVKPKPEPHWICQYKNLHKKINPNCNPKYVDPYHFYDELSKHQRKYKVLVTDQGAAFYCWSQVFDVMKGTISFTNGGFSPMGYGLPAAIGACIATGGPVVAVVGDGGLEMNIQELQTIAHYNLPIKIFVLENEGYVSIKNTQDNYFGGHYVGSDPKSGVSCVSAERIGKAYGIETSAIYSNFDTEWMLEEEFRCEGPAIISVRSDPHFKPSPKVVSVKNPDGTMSTPPLDVMEGE